MILVAVLAMLLGRPWALVDAVWCTAERIGLDPRLAVATVEYEAHFDPAKEVKHADGSSEWGLFQGYSRYHPQFRESIDKHILYYEQYLSDCIVQEGGSWERGLARFNGGPRWGPDSDEYARRVMKEYERVKEMTR